MKLKRARLADDLNEKIALRPGPLELVEKNIIPVDSAVKEAIKGSSSCETHVSCIARVCYQHSLMRLSIHMVQCLDRSPAGSYRCKYKRAIAVP